MSLLRLSLFPLILLMTAAPVQSQDSVDCSNALTQQAMNLCAGEDYAAADADLNEVWSELRQAHDGGPSWQSIVDAQRLWIPFRDAHCESEAAPFEGGSIQPLIRDSCLAHVTRQRTEQLRALMEPY